MKYLQPCEITCRVCGNLVVLLANEALNILFATKEQPGVIPEDHEKVVGDPSSIIDLIEEVSKKKIGEPSSMINLEELLGKEVSILPRPSIEIQEIEAAKVLARRFIAISDNMEAFIFCLQVRFLKMYSKGRGVIPKY